MNNKDLPIGLLLIGLLFGLGLCLWIANIIANLIASLLGFALGFITGAAILLLEGYVLYKLYRKFFLEVSEISLDEKMNEDAPKQDDRFK